MEATVFKATKPKRVPPQEKFVTPLLKAAEVGSKEFHEACEALNVQMGHDDPDVCLKSLLLLHLVLSRGPLEQSLGYLAGTTRPVELHPLIERFDFPVNVTRYAQYLNCRLSTYASLGSDIIKSKSDRNMPKLDARRLQVIKVEDGLLLEVEMLENMFNLLSDCVMEFTRCEPDELNDISLRYLCHDLSKLGQAITEGSLNSLQNFFTLNQRDSVRALELYDHHKDQLIKLEPILDLLRFQSYDITGLQPKLPNDNLVQSLKDYIHGSSPPVQLTPAPPRRKRSNSPEEVEKLPFACRQTSLSTKAHVTPYIAVA